MFTPSHSIYLKFILCNTNLPYLSEKIWYLFSLRNSILNGALKKYILLYQDSKSNELRKQHTLFHYHEIMCTRKKTNYICLLAQFKFSLVYWIEFLRNIELYPHNTFQVIITCFEFYSWHFAISSNYVYMYVKLNLSNYKTWVTSSSFAPYRESNTGGDPNLILTEIQGPTAVKNHNCNSRLSGHDWNLCIYSRLSSSRFFCFNNAVNSSYILRKSVMPNYRHKWRKM